MMSIEGDEVDYSDKARLLLASEDDGVGVEQPRRTAGASVAAFGFGQRDVASAGAYQPLSNSEKPLPSILSSPQHGANATSTRAPTATTLTASTAAGAAATAGAAMVVPPGPSAQPQPAVLLPAAALPSYSEAMAASDLVSGTLTHAALSSSGTASAATTGNRNATGASAPNVPMDINTLDEPVVDTIMRDLRSIWIKVKIVLMPKENKEILKNWDLWGPLLMCLSLAIILAIGAPSDDTINVFSLAFFIVWVGSGVVTLNSKLLGAQISFYQSVCVLGYCIFPLVIAALICLLINFFIVRLIIVGLACGWATYGGFQHG